MRIVWALIISIVAAQLPPTPTTSADFGFLTGCWSLERSGRIVEEHWLAPAGGMMLGLSRTVAGAKTVEFEFLQIRESVDGFAYVAKPSNQPEASFALISRDASSVVFENRSHDFPQRISYRRSGDSLHARIEGTVNGKSRAVDYPYTRTACDR